MDAVLIPPKIMKGLVSKECEKELKIWAASSHSKARTETAPWFPFSFRSQALPNQNLYESLIECSKSECACREDSGSHCRRSHNLSRRLNVDHLYGARHDRNRPGYRWSPGC